MIETTLDQLAKVLTRIDKQNQEILALLGGRANRKYIPLDDAAERLKRSVWTMQQLCKTGQVRAIKDEAGFWRIPTEEMERLEEEGAPKLPKRTPSSSPLSSRRGRGGGNDAASLPSGAPSMRQ